MCPGKSGVLILGSTCHGTGGNEASVLAFHGALADLTLFHMWGTDLGRTVGANQAALHSLLSEMASKFASGGGKQRLVVVVHDAEGACDAAVRAEVSAAWSNLRDGASFDEAIDVTSHALPDVSAEGFSDAVATLRAKLDTLLPGDDRKTDASQAAQVASAKWSAIEARVKAGTLLPPRDQLVSCNL